MAAEEAEHFGAAAQLLMLDIPLAPIVDHGGEGFALGLDGWQTGAHAIEHASRLRARLLDGQGVTRSDVGPDLFLGWIARHGPEALGAGRLHPDPMAAQFWIGLGIP